MLEKTGSRKLIRRAPCPSCHGSDPQTLHRSTGKPKFVKGSTEGYSVFTGPTVISLLSVSVLLLYLPSTYCTVKIRKSSSTFKCMLIALIISLSVRLF